MLDEESQNTRSNLEQAIAVLEAQRAILGDAVVDAALEPIFQKLESLRTSVPVEQRRKLASILFMDIAGHTQIVRDLDPEVNMEIIDRALARLAEPVRHHAGHIARYQGDGFKAVFGLPVTQEDDPVRAVQTGLDIISEAGRIAQELELERGIQGFTVRVGIDTGLIFSGGLTEGEDTIKGVPVNMGARLESAAQPGTILISHNTYQQVQDSFDVLPLEPILVKGFDKPVQVYRVLSAKNLSFHTRMFGMRGAPTPMIGRQDEFLQLQQAYQAALDAGSTRFFTILGEAGVGKSRLLYEFENWVVAQPAQVKIFRSRARPETQRIPYGLLREMFAYRFDIRSDDAAREMRRKLEDGFKQTLGDSAEWHMAAHIVGHFLGFDFSGSTHLQALQEDPRQLRDRALAYLVFFLKTAATAQPLLVLLEDLHWADGSSLDLISRITSALSGQPVILFGTARPDLLDRRTGWMEGQASHQWLHLYPLPVDQSSQMVAALLQNAGDVPEELLDLVSTRTDGNPFYIEEFIKMLIQEEVIATADGPWQVHLEKLADLYVPPTLAGILQARLDSLLPGERNILQQASVVGRVFWDEALVYLNRSGSQALPPSSIQQSLYSLQDKDLVYPRMLSAFAEASEHIFKHTLLRDVTYESVLLRLRRVYHARVAEWLIQFSQERLSEFSGMIADHLEQAGKGDLAVQYLQKAGAQAAASFANREAVEYYTRALSLVQESQLALRFDLLHARNLVSDLSGDRDVQAADLPVLEDLAEHAEGTEQERAVRQAKAAQRRSKYTEQMGDFKAAALSAERAVLLAQAAGDVQLQAAGRIRWIVALWRQGYYDEAQKLAEQTLLITQESGIRLYEAHALIQLGNIAWFHNRLQQASEYYLQALPIYQEVRYPAGLAAVYNNLGLVSQAQADDVGAEEYVRQAQEHFLQMGNTQGLAQAYVTLGGIAQKRWDYEQATRQFLTALKLVQEIHDRNYESIIYSHLGRINLDSGDFENALRYYNWGLEMAVSLGNRRSQCLILAEMGLTHALEAELEPACRLIEQALELADELGLVGMKASALLAYGYTRLASQSYDQASDVYVQLLSLCEQLDERHTELEARAGLGRAALAKNDLAAAREQAGAILEAIQSESPVSRMLSLHTYLVCIQILEALQDSQAEPLLQTAYSLLCQRQDNFQDPAARTRFIKSIPWHRELLDLWERGLGSRNS